MWTDVIYGKSQWGPCHMDDLYSLYIHVPFCVKKCGYCDFYSRTWSESAADGYIRALLQEWELVRTMHFNGKFPCIETVYIGGGTPSILTPAHWEKGIAAVLRECVQTPDTEVSMECNPESFSSAKALQWHHSGVNRLSIGIQSLDDTTLSLLQRPHDAVHARRVLDEPVLDRFSSVNADMLYALPDCGYESTMRDIETVIATASVTHCCAYELTLHPGTALYAHRTRLQWPSRDEVGRLYDGLQSVCAGHGFEHYEVSGYALPGYRCRHNLRYWQRRPYIGLGPGAHSFHPPVRSANVASLSRYCEMLARAQLPVQWSESLSPSQAACETLFLGLRCTDGIDAEQYRQAGGEPFYAGARKQTLDSLQRRGFVYHEATRWKPTQKGVRFADQLAVDLC